VLGRQEFLDWETSSRGFLWISGDAGQGKTVLSIYLARYLEWEKDPTASVYPHIATYFFCRIHDERRDNPTAIIRGLMFQLVQSNKELVRYLLPALQNHEERLFSSASFETLWGILIEMIKDRNAQQISFLLDGIDECDVEFRGSFLFRLKDLTNVTPNFRVIVTSRDHPKVAEAYLGDFTILRLESAEMKAALHNFISFKVKEVAAEKKYSEEETLETIDIFKQRSQGSFLWTQLATDHLRAMVESPVRNDVNGISEGLETLYVWLMKHISGSIERDRIRDILCWCTSAARPLAPGELAAALKIRDLAAGDVTARLRTEIDVGSLLLSFSPNAVRLVHHSLQEAIVQNQYGAFPLPGLEERHAMLASQCIACLETGCMQDNKQLPYRSGELNRPGRLGNTLRHYAGSHWDYHFRKAGTKEADALLDTHSGFFSPTSKSLDHWLRWRTGYGLEVFGDLAHVAAEFGLEALMRRILTRGFAKGKVPLKYSSDNPPKDWLQRTPLHRAARNGHAVLANMLTGLDARDFEGYTPLQYAAMSGSTDTVAGLLKAGADIEGSTGDDVARTPLFLAVERNDLPTVRFLLNRRAKLGRQDSDGNTTLMLVAKLGRHEALLNLLMSHASPTVLRLMNRQKQDVLHLACRAGLINTVRELLKTEYFDVLREDGEGNTLLHCAAAAPKYGAEMTQLLLGQFETVVDTANARNETPLFVALQYGQAETVRFWAMNMNVPFPRPSATSHLGALHTVVLRGSRRNHTADKIHMLVREFSVDPEARTLKSIGDFSDVHERHNNGYLETGRRSYSCQETALALAVMGGDVETVRVLVEEHACDVRSDCRSCDGATALHVAAQCCRADMVELLIKRWGADVNALDERRRTPLHALACRVPPKHEEMQRWETVRALLWAGSQVGLVDAHGRTPRDLFTFQSRSISGGNDVENYDKLVAEVSQS
jgi:ankyrin repeat protein